MPKAAIVDGHCVGIRLRGQAAIGIWSPSLSDMASIAMDFFAVAPSVKMFGSLN